MKREHKAPVVPVPNPGSAHGPNHPARPVNEDPHRAKEKAEESEVAGRHKNSGPKDHKGAR